MKRYPIHLILISTLLVFTSCLGDKGEDINAIIQHFKHQYAPDSRVALFDVQWDGDKLSGETNDAQALAYLKDSLEKRKITVEDKVRVLPDETLDGQHFAVVTLSVANLRSAPRHSAELATQATMGTPLSVLKKQEDWYLVQTPDRYISWVDAGGIALMDKEEMASWQSVDKLMFTPLYGVMFDSPKEDNPVSDLTAGNVLELVTEGSKYHQVRLPDGRTGFVPIASLTAFGDWIKSAEPSPDGLVRTAKNMMGVPYLWGGTSPKGVDCSGFTKTIFFLNGKIIPRDASQQIHEGILVDDQKDWNNLKVGDLLFFGTPAGEGKPERVVHVGMWIGHRSFIHSSGRVKISSFDPSSELYDEYEEKRYLRTKRIIGNKSRNILAVNEVIK